MDDKEKFDKIILPPKKLYNNLYTELITGAHNMHPK